VIRETRTLVPADSWERAQREYGERWEWSFIVSRAWNIVAFPSAPDLIPNSYRLLGSLENLGNVVEILPADREALLALEITPVTLHLQPAATAFDDKRAIINADPALSREVGRMVAALLDRERRGGSESVRVNPVRFVESDMHIILHKKWSEQNGNCALCRGNMVKGATNKLLQASVDRIDSQNAKYDLQNIQITHLGCNLAKNDVTMMEFAEWLAVLKGEKAIAAVSRG
jgi:hypothetical protein